MLNPHSSVRFPSPGVIMLVMTETDELDYSAQLAVYLAKKKNLAIHLIKVVSWYEERNNIEERTSDPTLLPNFSVIRTYDFKESLLFDFSNNKRITALSYDQVYGLKNNNNVFTTADLEIQAFENQLREQGVQQVTSNIISGNFYKDLLFEIERQRTECIIIQHKNNYDPASKFYLKNLTRFLSKSPLPVYVIQNNDTNFKKDSINIVLADDFTPESLSSIEFTKELANVLEKSSVYHLHIDNSSVDGLESIIKFFPKYLQDFEPSKNFTILRRLRAMELASQLEERAADLRYTLRKTNGTYIPLVRQGTVQREIKKALKDCHADICVFGRHHTVHTKPLSVGQMPYDTMLTISGNLVIST